MNRDAVFGRLERGPQRKIPRINIIPVDEKLHVEEIPTCSKPYGKYTKTA
jgi:hypothetical protein